jgi:hypothetical protein
VKHISESWVQLGKFLTRTSSHSKKWHTCLLFSADGGLLSWASNEGEWGLHAEEKAVTLVPLEERHLLQGGSALCIRVNAKSSQKMRLSKPCWKCANCLGGVGVSTMHYSNQQEEISTEPLCLLDQGSFKTYRWEGYELFRNKLNLEDKVAWQTSTGQRQQVSS